MLLLAVYGMVRDSPSRENLTPSSVRFLNLTTRLLLYCEGGVLASIEDPEEQKFIQSNVVAFQDALSSFWIGLYKSHKGIIILFTPA